MFLSEASVKRPIAMGALIIMLTLLGLNSARKLGLELMPKVDVPYITVITAYPGATPEEIETDIAKRIEDAVVTVDGLKHVTSSSMENLCQTLLEFCHSWPVISCFGTIHRCRFSYNCLEI